MGGLTWQMLQEIELVGTDLECISVCWWIWAITLDWTAFSVLPVMAISMLVAYLLYCLFNFFSRVCSVATDSNSEAIVCHLTLKNHTSLIVCIFYQRPSKTAENINLCQFLKTIVDNHPSLPIWIAGDLNLPNIDWEVNHTNGSAYPSVLCEIKQ